MEVTRTAIFLTVSRLGDLTAPLLYLSFAGHYMVNSLGHASLAWAYISFLTVVGIGLFSIMLTADAGSANLNADETEAHLIISLRLAYLLGISIAIGLMLYVYISPSDRSNSEQAHTLLTLSLSLPALYLQIVIFNFFTTVKKTEYELIYIWTLNTIFCLTCVILITTNADIDLIKFTLIYSNLRWLFAGAALVLFNKEIHKYIPEFQHSRHIPIRKYSQYLISGLPLALCIGGESLLFFLLSLISNSLDHFSLSAYQASLNFLSFVYMIAIGMGNAIGIACARHHIQKDLDSLRATYTHGLKLGLFTIAPVLLACYFLNDYISIIYTSHIETRKLIEKNILISIPFLAFEYIYVITRMTLRGMGDFWVPTLLTVSSLNIVGIICAIALLSFYDDSVHSIFLALVICSLLLMLLLTWRLAYKFHHYPHRQIKRRPTSKISDTIAS
ncbi:MATE family efflux transporter [Pseudomonas sp. Z1-14]|uniref:MATE family efflux transporter n=1 Tax=Pseudomonas sp. Z1-14 TaxID=2817409 RepID=UPI003DA9B057